MRAFAFAHRHALGTPSQIDEYAMIAVQLTSPNIFRCTPRSSADTIEPDSQRHGISSAGEPTEVSAPFRPLDPSIVNEAIPAFFIGRNRDGFWVARDARGRTGGVFLFEYSALAFARRNSRPAGCATIFPLERFELDLENEGNPLVGHLGSLAHFAMYHRQRVVAFIDKMAEAVKRRLKDFHFR
jgi:hypothetical protein